MTGAPLVYIIVLNYKRKDDTLDCLGTVQKMDYPNFRTVMVDNGSGDGSAEAVRAAFPDVEVIETGKNLMYAGGNNAGITCALERGADYVLLLNNDTVVDRSMLTRLVDAALSHPDAGIAGPMIYYYPPGRPEGEVIWYAGGIVEMWRGLVAHRAIRKRDTGLFADVETTGYVTGCGMLVSRPCMERVGMLDTSFNMYAEDTDLSLRAEGAGFTLLFVPAARMWHKVSMSMGGEFSLAKMMRKAASSLKLFVRYSRPWHWLTMPFFVAGRVALFTLRRLFLPGR
jgi:hypothetical protein